MIRSSGSLPGATATWRLSKLPVGSRNVRTQTGPVTLRPKLAATRTIPAGVRHR
jgi:hypothetical protein